jgi:diadenosine tetraphosphate (Ap4A) HIT family hydrolase
MDQTRASVSKLIFTTVKQVGKQPWVAPVFTRVRRFLPLQYVAQTDHAIAIKHPRAGWPGHVVITPTTVSRGLLSHREPIANRGFHMWQIYLLARDVAANQPEEERGHVLIINGGRRQEIGQMHGHLTPTLGHAGFPENLLEAMEEGIDERRFYNVEASPDGFSEWLRELEEIAPEWLANDRGFAVLIPIEPGVLPRVKITVDCDI